MRAKRLLSRAILVATVGLAALAPLALTEVAEASVSIAIPFDTLVHESTAVAFATPIAESSVWEGGRIVTYTQLHVDTRVAGDAGSGDPVWIRTLGGAVGHLGQSVEGEASFTVGRQSLLFLRALSAGMYTVTARAQGQFPVVLDDGNELRVHKSSGVGAIVPPRPPSGAVLAVSVLHGLKLTEATQAVTAAWGRLHAP
jgi:hypothetical protein